MTWYINALKLRLEDKDAKDEAYAELEKVRYEGCIRDMFTQIQTLNDKATVTGAAFKKLILERLPHKILEQMHMVDLTGRTDQEIMTIITNAGRTAEKWEAARNNLGLKNQFKAKEVALSRFRRKDRVETPKKERRMRKSDRSDRKKWKKERRPERGESKTAGIDPSEIQRRKAAGECLRCAWPADRKGSHRIADCKRPIKLDKGNTR
jgi:CHAT domain-containing protein